MTEYHIVGWKTSVDHAVAELSRPDREEANRYFSAEHVKVPTVRPQHVDMRVEEKQKIHDVRKTRIHEYSQPAETRGTVNDAVKASSWLWSTRHGAQLR